MTNKNETDTFLSNETEKLSSKSKKIKKKWWNQDYHHQEVIREVIESFNFRALIIFLVVLDTALVISEIILDSFKIHYECENKSHHSLRHHNEIMTNRIETAMKLTHYASITILSLFFIELLVKIYAFGREFWNIRRKKMEYFDAFIVITSLAIDLAFLHGEEKILGEKLMLILSFRLWRFVRIISSVSEAIRHGQRKHKKNLNDQYFIAVQRLVELHKHKTNYLENNKEDLDRVLKHFRMIDDQCQSSLDALDKNHLLTSSVIVSQFTNELYKLEDKRHDSIIAAMFAKPSEIPPV